MLRRTFVLLAAALTLLSPALARAAVEKAVPAGGGLDALRVRVTVSPPTLEAFVCAKAPCADASSKGTEPIRLAAGDLPDEKDVRIQAVDVGAGRQVLWVHIPSKTLPGTAFEAVVGGQASPFVHSSVTGYTKGQPGGMSGNALQLIDSGGKHLIVTGQLREDLTVCGQERTILAPRALNPSTLGFEDASLDRLSPAQRAAATRIVATTHAGSVVDPMARLLVPVGASSGESNLPWSERRPGVGRGEFLLFRGAYEVPVSRLSVRVTPPTPAKNGAAPKSFFLVTTTKTYAVTLPEDAWSHPGNTYDVLFPEPLRSSCVSLVLDDAYDHGQSEVEVTVADIGAYSELETPGATLATVAAALGVGGPRSDAAAGLLKRAGDRALAPLTEAWPKLDEQGRELAVDIAATGTCGQSTPLLLQGLCDASKEVSRKAESALARCNRAARIVDAVHDDKVMACPKVAGMLALLGREGALRPLALQLGKGDKDARLATRQAFATAAREATGDRLSIALLDEGLTDDARLEMLRALGPRVTEVAPEATKILERLLSRGDDFSVRYLALGPIAALAGAGNRVEVERLAGLLSHDKEWPIRAHAAELAIGVPGVQAALLGAIDDENPRVREAALRAVAAQKVSAAAVGVQRKLETDPWPFVRVAAADALGAMPPAVDVDRGLGTALKADTSSPVRVAILAALAGHRARGFSDAVRERVDDEREDPEVRVAAARALGALCDAKTLDRLTELARAAADPAVDQDTLALGLAAVDALGAMHPADLAARLSKLRGEGVRDAVKAAAAKALAMAPACR